MLLGIAGALVYSLYLGRLNMINHAEILNGHRIETFGTGYAWGFRLHSPEGRKIEEKSGYDTEPLALIDARDCVPSHQ